MKQPLQEPGANHDRNQRCPDDSSACLVLAARGPAMKYLCLAYEEEGTLDALSREEWDALRKETLDYVDDLRRSGRLIVTHALQSVRTATTVRVRHGRLSTTDGPYAETKESLGGFFLIEARDLNEAIQVAARWPSARLGSIEVRPIEESLREESRYGGVTPTQECN